MMIKNDSLKQIQQVAVENTEKVYEIVDKIIEILVEEFPNSKISYDEAQNRFGAVVDESVSVVIIPLINGVEADIISGEDVLVSVRLGANGSYTESRGRFTKEINSILGTFLWGISQIDITKQEDTENVETNSAVASDGTVVETVTEG